MVLNRKSFLDTVKLATEEVEIEEGKSVIMSEIGAQDYIKLWTKFSEETGENHGRCGQKGILSAEGLLPDAAAFERDQFPSGDRVWNVTADAAGSACQ